MIKICRNRNDENGNPIRPPQTWFNKASAKTTVAKMERENHAPDENIYRDIDLSVL